MNKAEDRAECSESGRRRDLEMNKERDGQTPCTGYPVKSWTNGRLRFSEAEKKVIRGGWIHTEKEAEDGDISTQCGL